MRRHSGTLHMLPSLIELSPSTPASLTADHCMSLPFCMQSLFSNSAVEAGASEEDAFWGSTAQSGDKWAEVQVLALK